VEAISSPNCRHLTAETNPHFARFFSRLTMTPFKLD
jgi:hypothetical protein